MALGPHLRELYVRRKSDLIGRAYRPHPRWDTPQFWTKVASVCWKLNAQPHHFLDAQFYDLGAESKDGPFPNMLVGKSAEFKYRRYVGRYNLLPPKLNETGVVQDTQLVSDALAALWEEANRSFDGDIVETLTCTYSTVPAWLRLLLLPDDAVVAEFWGSDGCEDLVRNASLREQAKLMGYPVDRVMQEFFKR